MLWLAIFLFALGFEHLLGVYVEPSPHTAFGCWIAAAACLLVAGYRQHRTIGVSSLFGGLTLAAVVLATQTLFYVLYERLVVSIQAYPWLAAPFAAVLRLLDFEAAALAGQVHVQTGQHLLTFSVAPEQLGLPFLTLLVLPGLVLRLIGGDGDRAGALRAMVLAVLAGAVYAWIRLTVLVALFTDYGSLDVLWRPLWIGIAFAPLVPVLAYLVPLAGVLPSAAVPFRRREAAFAAVTAMAVTLIVSVNALRLPAPETPSTVMIDDAHSDWAWTDVEFARDSFTRQATYSYTDMVRFLGYYYELHVNDHEAISTKLLSGVDTLILKTPTRPFGPGEITAVVDFVRRGGGLILIGDHTNLFGMTTNMNPLADRFGLHFVADATYDLTTGRPTSYRPTFFKVHPVATLLERLRFETSCSIVAAPYAEHVLVGYGLGKEMVDYSHVNFFGNIKVDPEDRFGMFLQAAAVSYGQGRVFAFSDSTIFSNFSVFQQGRAELLLAAVEYVRGAGSIGPWVGWLIVPLLGLGAVALLAGKGIVAPTVRAGVPGGAAGLLLAFGLVRLFHAAAFELPAPARDYPVIAFERQFSQFRLPSMIEVGGGLRDRSFDAFFVATQRLGFVPRIRHDFTLAARESDPLVMINPVGAVYESHANALWEFVNRGGNLLMMVDDRGPFYTANALLSRFNLAVVPVLEGVGPDVAGGVDVQGIDEVALPANLTAQAGSFPRIFYAAIGDGSVVLVVGAQYFSQEWMGPVFNNPDDAEKALYRLEYYVIEELLMQETGQYAMQ